MGHAPSVIATNSHISPTVCTGSDLHNHLTMPKTNLNNLLELQHMPNEIFTEILHYLHFTHIIHLSQGIETCSSSDVVACKNLFNFCSQDFIWKYLYESYSWKAPLPGLFCCYKKIFMESYTHPTEKNPRIQVKIDSLQKQLDSV